jgi:hypothetical protein
MAKNKTINVSPYRLAEYTEVYNSLKTWVESHPYNVGEPDILTNNRFLATQFIGLFDMCINLMTDLPKGTITYDLLDNSILTKDELLDAFPYLENRNEINH